MSASSERGIGSPTALLFSAQRRGVLPLTSVCNMNCLFCSHRFNPPGVKVLRLPPRPLAEVEESLAWLSGSKVVIGESVTRIIEGEPFTHPQIMEILTLLRRRFPEKLLAITSNGSLLDERRVKELAKLAPVELTISLNSANPRGRAFLMRDRQPEAVMAALRELAGVGLPFHGSIVAMPHLVGWEDLQATIGFLDQVGARTVRVFLPGFTRLTPPELRFPRDLPDQLQAFLAELRQKVTVPLLLEPPPVRDVEAVVEGVISSSPADGEGVRPGDVILAVDGMAPFSRVQAFQLVLAAARPRLLLRRGEALLEVTLDKEAGESSGLAMLYDLDPGIMGEIERALATGQDGRARPASRRQPPRGYGPGKVGRCAEETLLLASSLGAPALRAGLAKKGIPLTPYPVENVFFGGSIGAAGLLVVQDFIAAIQKVQEKAHGRYRRALLPGRPFDEKGHDLVGRSYLEIEEVTGIRVEVLGEC